MARILMIALALVLSRGAASAATLYVAPTGSDAWSGTLSAPNKQKTDGPFATLERARDEIRKWKAAGPLPKGGVTVFVRGGTYELPRPLALTAEDSGTPEAPITYRAYAGEKPTLVSARAVTGFQPYRGKILRCSLKGTPLAGVDFRQLFFRGERMVMARYPNVDPKDPHFGEWAYVLAPDGKESRDRFLCTDDVVKEWSRVQRAEVCIHPSYGWAWSIVPIKAVSREEKKITLARNVPYDLRVGDRFFVRNLLEELDAPGEWYLDREADVLYFWPPADLARGKVLAPVAASIVTMRGARHLTVRGFTLEACDGDAVRIQGSENCVVAGCVLRNTGAWAVRVEDSRRCGALGNDIYATGAGGISLSGGNRKTLERGDNFATNNYIHHIAEFQRTYYTGVNLVGVGNTASHNLIHDCYHQAILMGGNDNVVEYNIIHHTNLGSEDTGGFYMSSRDYTVRGGIVRHNIFHHIGGFGKANAWAPVRDGKVKYEYPHFTFGIYLDAPETGMHIYGNVLYKVPTLGMFNHSGKDNVWENNIVVDAPAFRASVWGRPELFHTSWDGVRRAKADGSWPAYLARYPELARYDENEPRMNTMFNCKYIRNIAYYTPEGGKWLRDRNRTAWDGGQLLLSYRGHRDDFAEFVFDSNLVYAPPGVDLKVELTRTPEARALLSWEEWRQTGKDTNSLFADPLFVNPAKHDYRLKPESPAYKLGFKPIPFEKIGPYQDKTRASWPIVEAPGAAALGDFTTERYFVLPDRATSQAEVRAPRARGVVVDGDASEWPWNDPKQAFLLAEDPSGSLSHATRSQVCVAYDDEALYIAARHPVRKPEALVMAGVWGQRDGMEIALQDSLGQTPGPILNLYGYPDGTFQSVTTAGATREQADALAKATTFRAKRTAQGWDCEWRIAWAGTGISPLTVKRMRFNLAARKVEESGWVLWKGSGYTFQLENAGILSLADR